MVIPCKGPGRGLTQIKLYKLAGGGKTMLSEKKLMLDNNECLRKCLYHTAILEYFNIKE